MDTSSGIGLKRRMEVRKNTIDGRIISKEIREKLAEEVRKENPNILFSLVVVGDNPVTENFVRYKIRFGRRIGISPVVFRFPDFVSQEELNSKVRLIAEQSDALVVQLPLPNHIDTDTILSQIPPEKDVDVLSQEALSRFAHGEGFFPPVTRAVLHALGAKNIPLKGKNVVLYGYGRLVGKPFALYLERENIPFSLIRSSTDEKEREELLREADVVVSGVGIPGIIRRDDVREGVVVIDAGTSESSGSVVGDLHPDAYRKTAFYTPVPGGIGPLTIASLFENVWEAWKRGSE